MKSLVRAGLLGGLVLFVWSMISWMVLPFHHKTLNGFAVEPAVEQILGVNTSGAGVYVLPMKDHKKMEKGPFAFVVWNPQGNGPMLRGMIGSLVVQVVIAMLTGMLLLRTNLKKYWDRVFFVTLFAFAGAFMCDLPYAIWWGFPPGFIMLDIADHVIGLFLAGMVMAKT